MNKITIIRLIQGALLLLLVQPLFFSSLSFAADLDSFTVSDQGQVYEVPLQGWDFKRKCGSGMCPIKDIEIMARLARGRDAFKQTISPDHFLHADLAKTLGKLTKSTQLKQTLNQFDQALTNVAGTYIGTALRTAVGDPTAAVSIVTGAISTTAAAGSSIGSAEALGLGVYFSEVAVSSAEHAAAFQKRYFSQSPVGWTQMRTFTIADLETAAGNAHEALRLAAPAAVLMTKVTDRSGWDTLSSFLRNTFYASVPGGYGDIYSTLDSAVSTAKKGIVSVKALRVFDREINHGRQNPFDTDLSLYRDLVVEHGGLKDEPRRRDVKELLRVAEKDLQAGRLTVPKYDSAFDKYKKVLNLADRQPDALKGLDRILSEYDRKLNNWQTDPIRAAKSCRELRDVLIFRWHAGKFSSEDELERWGHQFPNSRACVKLKVAEELLKTGAYDECERELNASAQFFEQVLRDDCVGTVIKKPQEYRDDSGRAVADIRMKLFKARRSASKSKQQQIPGRLLKSQSFPFSYNGYDARFVPYGSEDAKLQMYLKDNEEKVIFKFPEFYGNRWGFDELLAVSFVDIDHDGRRDILLITNCIAGIGPTGYVPFKVFDVYFADKDRFFVKDLAVSEKINNYRDIDTILDLKNRLADVLKKERQSSNNKIMAGIYKKDDGVLEIKDEENHSQGFVLQTIGANYSSCSLSGKIENFKATEVDSSCKIRFAVNGHDINVVIEGNGAEKYACQSHYCGMRVSFEGFYQFSEPHNSGSTNVNISNSFNASEVEMDIRDLYGTWKNKYVTYTFTDRSFAVRTRSDNLVSPYTVDRIDGNKIVLKFSNGKTRSFIIKEKNKVITDVGFFDDYDDCYRVN